MLVFKHPYCLIMALKRKSNDAGNSDMPNNCKVPSLSEKVKVLDLKKKPMC